MGFEAVAIDKVLNRSPGRLVLLAGVIEKHELRPELPVELLGGIAGDGKPTALLGAVRREGRHDDMAKLGRR